MPPNNTANLFRLYTQRTDAMLKSGIMTFTDYVSALRAALSESAQMVIEAYGEGWQAWYETGGMTELMGAIDESISQYELRVTGQYAEMMADTFDAAGKAGYADAIGLSLQELPSLTAEYVNQSMFNEYRLIRQIVPAMRNDIIDIFRTSLEQRLGPAAIAAKLRDYGDIPWSPTGRFSPEARAAMIADEEYARIRESINRRMANAGEARYCFNMLNPALRTHSDQCLAATAAGVITVDRMEKDYGMPHRHVGCGCTVGYTSIKGDKQADEMARSQLSIMEEQGVDVNEATERWNETGPATMNSQADYRARMVSENDALATFMANRF